MKDGGVSTSGRWRLDHCELTLNQLPLLSGTGPCCAAWTDEVFGCRYVSIKRKLLNSHPRGVIRSQESLRHASRLLAAPPRAAA